MPLERASQGEKNDASFSVVAPSSEELRVLNFPKSSTVTTFTMHVHLNGHTVLLQEVLWS